MTHLFAIASILSLALIALVCGLNLMTQAARVAFSRKGVLPPPPPPLWSRSPGLELPSLSEQREAEAKAVILYSPFNLSSGTGGTAPAGNGGSFKLAQKRARMPQEETDRIRLAGAGKDAGSPESASKKGILSAILVGLLVFAPQLRAQKTQAGQNDAPGVNFPLDASAWTINPGTVQSIAYPFNGETNTACFNFPRSPIPDPNDSGPWYGYFLQPWRSSIQGSALSISYRIKEARQAVAFNWKSEAGNTCPAPAALRLYFQSGDLYNADGFNRWWSNPVHAELGPGVVTLTVALDPSQWSETFGRGGNQNPSAFYATLEHPSYIGVTFGGGCFFGHGVNVTGGKAQFQLLEFSTQ